LILGLGLGTATALVILDLVRGLHLPRWTALLLAGAAFTAIVARSVGGLSPVTGILDQIGFTIGTKRVSLLAIVQIGITLLILFAVVRLVSRLANHSIRRAGGLDATQQLLAQKLVGVGLLVAAFFIGIDIIGIDLTALAVFSGAFGLAVGFGLQKTFGNLIAGIILLMDRSIKPGDVIVVGESFGHVTKIGVRAVSIVTRDGKEHLIPNENLMTQEVENWSYSSPNVRVHIPVGVSYECDLALAQRLMVEAAMEPARVLKSPKPTVWLRAFGESSVDHEILVWIADPEAGVGNVQSEILNRLWVLFKENGVEIPYAQRDIRVKEWPGPPPS
jgi:small-conductance mechanosensitive channel